MSLIVKDVKIDRTIQVDSVTGEILEDDVNTLQVVITKDKFTLVYSEFWDKILGTNLSASDLELLAYLINHYSDNASFSVTNDIRMAICEKSGKSVNSYKKSTRSLLDAGFIYASVNSSKSYKINPLLAFKGSTKDRKKVLLELVQSEDVNNCFEDPVNKVSNKTLKGFKDHAKNKRSNGDFIQDPSDIIETTPIIKPFDNTYQ